MNKTLTDKAAGLIVQCAEAAAIKAAGPDDCPIEIGNVRFTPAAGNRFATVAVQWSTGPAWGELVLEFHPLRSYAPAIGLWRRGQGVAVTPAGFPMLPAFSAAMREIADGCLAACDQSMPAGF